MHLSTFTCQKKKFIECSWQPRSPPISLNLPVSGGISQSLSLLKGCQESYECRTKNVARACVRLAEMTGEFAALSSSECRGSSHENHALTGAAVGAIYNLCGFRRSPSMRRVALHERLPSEPFDEARLAQGQGCVQLGWLVPLVFLIRPSFLGLRSLKETLTY